MIKAITVDNLLKALTELSENGKGDYQIFLTNDEEGNGYHACWYLPEAADEMDEEGLHMCTDINDDESILDDITHAVYLG